MKNIKKIKFILIVFVLVFSLLVFANKLVNPQSNGGSLLKNLPALDIFGDPIKYDQELYVLNIWATWCHFCVNEIPDLVELQEEYREQKVLVLGLSTDKSKQIIAEFAVENNLNYPVTQLTKDVAKTLPRVSGIPTTFIISKKGVILTRFPGYTPKEQFVEVIEKYLNQ